MLAVTHSVHTFCGSVHTCFAPLYNLSPARDALPHPVLVISDTLKKAPILAISQASGQKTDNSNSATAKKPLA